MGTDQFLQQCCDEMEEKSIVITPESLADYQNEYDLATCRWWLEETCNG